MPLLTLKDIGKIYVSEGNVAVGIRGVNLSFDRGEFVAVTGASGSGKSTLLNILGGTDSYEEGEMYVEGKPTSHYLQPDWEQYRSSYVSFIYQDYNIIESFTVLQNVEMALMHVEDRRERRRRAMELIRRVGLASHCRHKGSRLSGGQKQRTVIARALAKDSPILLADEPTGNLDSATSAEIIDLLREVSRDKLLIVVTHNFEQVEEYATRHIRIFDGAVESDRALRPPVPPAEESTPSPLPPSSPRSHAIRKGIGLGLSIFTAKPRLSLFLCLLMMVGTLGIFLTTSLCGEAADVFAKNYMFNPIPGRLIVTHRDCTPLTDEELDGLRDAYGASDVLHYDALLDEDYYTIGYTYYDAQYGCQVSLELQTAYGKSFGSKVLGRYPSAANEVLLYLPITYRPLFGKDSLLIGSIWFGGTPLTVTGVKYFYDNNKEGCCLFTEEGFRLATAVHFFTANLGGNSFTVRRTAIPTDPSVPPTTETYSYTAFAPAFDMGAGKIYAPLPEATQDSTTTVEFEGYCKLYRFNNSAQTIRFGQTFGEQTLTGTPPAAAGNESKTLFLSPDLFCALAEEGLQNSYCQASLFFASNAAAHRVAGQLNAGNYLAVPADTTYSPSAGTVILNMLGSVLLAAVWVLSILFFSFFISLCSGRALAAFKGDMAILRSMGIPVRIIRIGMYVRMLLSLLPSLFAMGGAAYFLFTSPRSNGFFDFLYPWQYAAIVLGMLLLTVRTTRKQIGRLFGESVKKALKGGGVA